MSAPVLPPQPLKLAAGPAPLTPDQAYWRSFKDPLTLRSLGDAPIVHISSPAPLVPASTTSTATHNNPGLFAVTAGLRVQLYSTRTRAPQRALARFAAPARTAHLRRDGRALATGDDSGAVQVFDPSSRAILRTWHETKQPTHVAQWAPGPAPTRLASAGDDGAVRLWDLSEAAPLATLRGHTDYVHCGAWMGELEAGPAAAAATSGLLVTGGYDQTTRLWDPRTPSPVLTFRHAAPVEAVRPLPGATALVAAAGPGAAVLDLVAARPRRRLADHQKTVTALALASGGTRALLGGLDGHVKAYDTAAWAVVWGQRYPAPVRALAVVTAPGGGGEDRHLCVGLQSGVLSVRTRLAGAEKARDAARKKEMAALERGAIERHDAAVAECNLQTRRAAETAALRPRTLGEGGGAAGGEEAADAALADAIVEGRAPKRLKKPLRAWERALHEARYAVALDAVLGAAAPAHPTKHRLKGGRPNAGPATPAGDAAAVATVLTALRRRSALRAALAGRDAVGLAPVLRWVRRHVADARHVELCADVAEVVLDLYAGALGPTAAAVDSGGEGEGLGGRGGFLEGRELEAERRRGLRRLERLLQDLHAKVRREVDGAQVAWQTGGMLTLMAGT